MDRLTKIGRQRRIEQLLRIVTYCAVQGENGPYDVRSTPPSVPAQQLALLAGRRVDFDRVVFRVMRIPFVSLLVCIFCGSAPAADFLPLGELGKPSPLKFAEGEMLLEIEGSSMRVEAPSFWKWGWQVRQPALPGLEADGEKRLVVRAEGSSANEELTLKVRLVSADWSRADLYEIPLSGLAPGTPGEFASGTPYGEPSEQENGGLTGGEPPGAIQFLLAGKGRAPVQLVLHAIGLQ